MKSARKSNRIIDALLLLCSLALLVPVYFYWKDNDVTLQNKTLSNARKAYESREYVKAYKAYQQLIDSLGFRHDAALFNYGNAALLSSDFLNTGLRNTPQMDYSVPDSIAKGIAEKANQLFFEVSRGAENSLSSKGSNQLGYMAIKAGESSGENEMDNKLAEALEHFKEALKKDPNNENARYNYELIKKIYGFPETILSEVRSLVAENRYREAAALLETSMQRDVRLRSQKELLNRIRSVIKIDSAFSRRNL